MWAALGIAPGVGAGIKDIGAGVHPLPGPDLDPWTTHPWGGQLPSLHSDPRILGSESRALGSSRQENHSSLLSFCPDLCVCECVPAPQAGEDRGGCPRVGPSHVFRVLSLALRE